MGQTGMHINIFKSKLNLAILEILPTLKKLEKDKFITLGSLNRFGAQVGVARTSFFFEKTRDSQFSSEENFTVEGLTFLVLLPENVGIDPDR